MTLRAQRCVLILLGLSAAFVGAWALAAPRSFYDSFPGLGRHWVVATGPYNEHFVRDVGGLYLALLVVSAWAAVRPERSLSRMAGVAWLVFSIPHLIYHASHLDMFGTLDKVGLMVTLGGTVVLAAALLPPQRRS